MEDLPGVERRHFSIREIVMMVTLILNFGGLVWGAATVTSTVNQLSIAVGILERTVGRVVSDLYAIKVDYNARLRVLEDRQSKR